MTVMKNAFLYEVFRIKNVWNSSYRNGH